jgi:hypothetical protein
MLMPSPGGDPADELGVSTYAFVGVTTGSWSEVYVTEAYRH